MAVRQLQFVAPCWRTLSKCLCFLGIALAALPLPAADPLELLRSEVRAADTPDSRPSNASASAEQQRAAACRADRQSFNDDHGDNELWGKLVLAGLVAPYWLPATFTGDDYVSRASFPSYPYQVDSGYLVLDSGECAIPPGIVPGAWLLRGGSDFGTNFSGTNWVGAQILLDTSTRFGFDSLRTSVGLNWRHAEAYFGYDLLHVESFDLNSLVGGVRLWF